MGSSQSSDSAYKAPVFNPIKQDGIKEDAYMQSPAFKSLKLAKIDSVSTLNRKTFYEKCMTEQT